MQLKKNLASFIGTLSVWLHRWSKIFYPKASSLVNARKEIALVSFSWLLSLFLENSFTGLLNLRDGLSFHEVIAVYRVAVLMLSFLCNRVEVDCRGVLVLYTNGLPNPNSVDMEFRNYK